MLQRFPNKIQTKIKNENGIDTDALTAAAVAGAAPVDAPAVDSAAASTAAPVFGAASTVLAGITVPESIVQAATEAAAAAASTVALSELSPFPCAYDFILVLSTVTSILMLQWFCPCSEPLTQSCQDWFGLTL